MRRGQRGPLRPLSCCGSMSGHTHHCSRKAVKRRRVRPYDFCDVTVPHVLAGRRAWVQSISSDGTSAVCAFSNGMFDGGFYETVPVAALVKR